MSEMVERVANALMDSIGHDTIDYRVMARAAIKAMREPTEAMSEAGFDNEYCTGPDLAWEAMIDEALK